MQCRSCGTTIADKAIICFRCGAPTDLPVRTPAGRTGPPGRPPGPSWPAALAALAVLVLGAWVATTPEWTWAWRAAPGAGVVAAAYAAWRLLAPRHPRGPA